MAGAESNQSLAGLDKAGNGSPEQSRNSGLSQEAVQHLSSNPKDTKGVIIASSDSRTATSPMLGATTDSQSSQVPIQKVKEKSPIEKEAAILHEEINAKLMADRKAVFQILEKRSEKELQELNKEFQKISGGKTLEQAIEANRSWCTWNNSEIDRALNAVKFNPKGDAERSAAFVHEMNEKLTENKLFSAPGLNEKALREQLNHLTAKQIEEMKQAYEKQYSTAEQKRNLTEDLKNNPNISAATKEAISIYLKGSEHRSDSDKLRLADIAIRTKDLALFQEALGKTPGLVDTNASAREKFMNNGTGYDTLVRSFSTRVMMDNGLLHHVETNHRLVNEFYEVAKNGHFDVLSQIKLNTGWTGSNEGIAQALRSMTIEQKEQYMRGKALLAQGQNAQSTEQRESVEYYKQIHSALENANSLRNLNLSDKMVGWENIIANKAVAPKSEEEGVRPARTEEENIQDRLRDYIDTSSGFARGALETQLTQALRNNSEALRQASEGLAKLSPERQEAMKNELLSALKAFKTDAKNCSDMAFTAVNAMEVMLLTGSGVGLAAKLALAGAMTKQLTNKSFQGEGYEFVSSQGMKEMAVGALNAWGGKYGSDQAASIAATMGMNPGFIGDMAIRAAGNGTSSLLSTGTSELISNWNGDPDKLADALKAAAPPALLSFASAFGFSCAGSLITATRKGWKPGLNPNDPAYQANAPVLEGLKKNIPGSFDGVALQVVGVVADSSKKNLQAELDNATFSPVGSGRRVVKRERQSLEIPPAPYPVPASIAKATYQVQTGSVGRTELTY